MISHGQLAIVLVVVFLFLALVLLGGGVFSPFFLLHAPELITGEHRARNHKKLKLQASRYPGAML